MNDRAFRVLFGIAVYFAVLVAAMTAMAKGL